MTWESIFIREVEKRLGPAATPRLNQTAEQILGEGREEPQIIYPLAWVYTSDFPGNAWRGHPVLLAAIQAVGTKILAGVPGRRTWYPLCHAFRLVRTALSAEMAAEWKKQIVHHVNGHLLPELKKRERLTEYSSANVGYGTNHLTVELSGLTAYIAAFKDDADYASLQPGGPALAQFASAYLGRFMEYMNPDGYWPECDGPADSYNSLTASSLLRAAHDLGEVARYSAYFRATAHYAALAILPDGRGTDITDGRNHFKSEAHVGGRRCYCGFSPESKLIRDMSMQSFERRSMEPPRENAESLHEVLHNLLLKQYDVPEPAVSLWSAPERTESLQSGFHYIKRGKWIAAASTFFSMPRPEGHWNLDYQNLWTLYHERFGQILFGANGKNDPELATFHKFFVSADGMVVRDQEALRKFLPGKGRYESRANGFRLWRAYRGFEGVLDLTIESATRATLAIRVDARDDAYPVTFTLMPVLEYGQLFGDGRGRSHKLGADPFTLTGAALDGELVLPPAKVPNALAPQALETPLAVTLELPPEAELVWPYAAWDPYNLKTDRYEKIEDQTLRLRIPVGPKGAKIAFRVG